MVMGKLRKEELRATEAKAQVKWEESHKIEDMHERAKFRLKHCHPWIGNRSGWEQTYRITPTEKGQHFILADDDGLLGIYNIDELAQVAALIEDEHDNFSYIREMLTGENPTKQRIEEVNNSYNESKEDAKAAEGLTLDDLLS